MIYLRKYNTLTVTGTTAIVIPITKFGSTRWAKGADWTPSAGDVKIRIDAAAAVNVTNLPTAKAMGNTAVWEFILVAAELVGKQIEVTCSDNGVAIEDDGFVVETYGNAAAMYQADISANALPSNAVSVMGTSLTESVTGRVAGAFSHLFDVATPNLTAAMINQTGDAFARLGAPAGASVSADIAALFTTALAESYRTNGAVGTPAQLLYEILSFLTEKAKSGVTVQGKKLDHSTNGPAWTLNDATTPTSITRSA
jgi:hypothetical protein